MVTKERDAAGSFSPCKMCHCLCVVCPPRDLRSTEKKFVPRESLIHTHTTQCASTSAKVGHLKQRAVVPNNDSFTLTPSIEEVVAVLQTTSGKSPTSIATCSRTGKWFLRKMDNTLPDTRASVPSKVRDTVIYQASQRFPDFAPRALRIPEVMRDARPSRRSVARAQRLASPPSPPPPSPPSRRRS